MGKSDSGTSKIMPKEAGFTDSSQDYVLDFQRYEYKYVVPSHLIEAMIPDILNYMNYDSHSKGEYYKLYSVYFDTFDMTSFYEKIAGIERRKKYRIKSARTPPSAAVDLTSAIAPLMNSD